MTDVDASPTPVGTEGRLVPASCRVTILVGDNTQVDLVLPAALPLTLLVDSAVDECNRVLRARGEQELPAGVYEFARVGNNALLDPDVSLTEHGIRDGKHMLVLLPAGEAERYGPVVENISTALARWGADHFPAVSPRDAILTAAALLACGLGLAAVLVWRMRWAAHLGWITGGILAAASLGASLAARYCRRGGAPRPVVVGACWTACAAAVLAGGVLPPGAHPGAPHALLAGTVAVLGATVAAKTTQTRLVPSAIIAIAAPAAAAAAARMFFDTPGQRIALAALVGVLIASRMAPVVGLWLAKVPRQPFGRLTGEDIFAALPEGTDESVSPVTPPAHDITPSGEQIGELALRSNRVLSGVLIGVAVVQVGASVAAINPHHGSQWPFVVVTAVVALALLLRARSTGRESDDDTEYAGGAFRHRWHNIITVAGAVGALYAIPAHYGLAAPAGGLRIGLVAAAVILLIAVCGLAAASVVPIRHFAPPLRVYVEYVEYVAIAAVIPFAAWAIGIFHYTRFH